MNKKQIELNDNQSSIIIEDLAQDEAAAENVKGGLESANNLKQIGIAWYSIADSR